jgi:hypothetical protein
MARPRKMRRLNDAKSEVIAENVLQENPQGFQSTEDLINEKVVIAKHIPEYRKVVFINGRDPGYPLDFHYSSKTHPLKIYKLLHGKEYDLPVEIIEHLESCSEPVYAYRRGLDGHPEMYVVSRKYIFQCRTPAKSSMAQAA